MTKHLRQLKKVRVYFDAQLESTVCHSRGHGSRSGRQLVTLHLQSAGRDNASARLAVSLFSTGAQAQRDTAATFEVSLPSCEC